MALDKPESAPSASPSKTGKPGPAFRPRSWWKVVAWFIGAAAVMALLIFLGPWSGSEIGRRLNFGAFFSTDSEPIRVEVGGKRFDIPRNYIWAVSAEVDGKHTGANMHALLPDFEPMTKENRSEFRRPGRNRKIVLLISEHSTDKHPSPMSSKDVFHRIAGQNVTSVSAGPYGLRVVEPQRPRMLNREIYVGETLDREFFFLECDRNEAEISPGCKSVLAYSDHVYVTYTFGRPYLENWQRINDGVKNLVRSMEVAD